MTSSIPDTALGLSHSEVQLLRQHQQIALSQQGSSSSRAASHASSQGRLLLDPSSLQALSAHFDRLMGSIQQRWHYVRRLYLIVPRALSTTIPRCTVYNSIPHHPSLLFIYLCSGY